MDDAMMQKVVEAIEQRAREYRRSAEHLRLQPEASRYLFEQAGKREAHAEGLEWAALALRAEEAKDYDVCWHCGDHLIKADPPRCEGCPNPDECETDDCDKPGCANPSQET
jgi:hypothetical protein